MPRLVVTLSPHANDAIAFARRARSGGADLLEVRTDLHVTVPIAALANEIDLLLAERGRALPIEWRLHARLIDREAAEGASLVSHHAAAPLAPDEAVALWAGRALPAAVLVKHVEPLGDLVGSERLLETQARLLDQFGPRVTVLATGAAAAPLRARLAERNALDYLALDPDWAAAPGQRLLVDAIQASRR